MVLGIGRPKVVDIIGINNSGKSNLVLYLERYSGPEDKPNVLFIQDQIRQTSVTGELNKNLWALGRIRTLVLEAKEQARDLIVIERGAGATFASLNAFLRIGNHIEGAKDRRKAESGIVTALDFLKQEEDFFILIKASTAIAMSRDAREGKDVPGIFANPSFLDELQESYRLLEENHLPSSRKKIVDGNLDLKDDTDKVKKCRERIITKLVSLVPEGT